MQDETQNKLLHRLNRIEGQVRGIRQMVQNDEYCIDILNQSSATRSAISSFEDELLKNHLSEHVADQIKRGDTEQVTDEILHVFKNAKK